MPYIVTGWKFGHEVEFIDDKWIYRDTGEDTNKSPQRKCPKCQQLPTEDGSDPCIANLPGVKAACCGHGVDKDAYILFTDGTCIRFRDFKIERNNFPEIQE